MSRFALLGYLKGAKGPEAFNQTKSDLHAGIAVLMNWIERNDDAYLVIRLDNRKQRALNEAFESEDGDDGVQ